MMGASAGKLIYGTLPRLARESALRGSVKNVHDLRIWTITSGRDALSAHVIVPKGQDRDDVLRKLEQILHERFRIDHLTLQIVEEREEYIQPK